MNTATRGTQRLPSIDIARFFAIALVFYGHLVEQFMQSVWGRGIEHLATAAEVHYKWVYSFHMPAFFLLAGMVFNSRHLSEGIAAHLRRRWSGRVQPYLVFSAVAALMSFVIAGWFPTMGAPTAIGPLAWESYLWGLVDTLRGLPAFSIPLWFLAALVSVELFHYLVGRWLTTTPRRLAAIVVAYIAGIYLNRWINFFPTWTFWLVNLVPLGYAFYLSGIVVRRSGVLERTYPRWQLAVAALVLLAGVTLTYDLNQGPFFGNFDAVIVVAGGVGHIGWFPLTALMGTALVLVVARLVPQWRWLQYLGEITITIYGLHGLFYHFVNPRIVAPLDSSLGQWLTQSAGIGPIWALLAVATIVTAASVAATAPAAWAVHRYAPQLIGRG
jgi:acyltransferase